MKKIRKAAMFMITMAAAFLLNACVGPQYKPEEEAALRDRGQNMMQEWLDLNLPGEKVAEAEAYIDIFLGGPHKLTDFVNGTYSENGGQYRFLINTASGEIFTSKGMEEMQGPAWDYMLEKLELDPQEVEKRTEEEGALTGFAACLYIKSKTDGSAFEPLHDFYLESVLPVDVVYGGPEEELTERIGRFLEDPKREHTISFRADLELPDETDISRFSPGGLMRMQDTDGIYYEWARIHNKTQDLWHYGWMGHYCRYGWVDLGDFRIWSELDYISDKRNPKAEAGFDREEIHVDPADFCPIIPTEDGYRIEYPEELTHNPAFRIVAKPDSEIMRYDYLHTSDGGKTTRDCHWQQRRDGDWDLVNFDWFALNFGYNMELKRRGGWDPEHPETKPES